MADIEKEVFYVHLDQPVEIRRYILESSRQMVQLLQRYETIRDIRVKKAEETTKLKKNFRELIVLINKLKQEMPKVGGRVKVKQESKAPAKSKSGTKKTTSKSTAVHKLEEELRMIESKLNSLS